MIFKFEKLPPLFGHILFAKRASCIQFRFQLNPSYGLDKEYILINSYDWLKNT